MPAKNTFKPCAGCTTKAACKKAGKCKKKAKKRGKVSSSY